MDCQSEASIDPIVAITKPPITIRLLLTRHFCKIYLQLKIVINIKF